MVSGFAYVSLLDLTFSCVSTKLGEKDSNWYLYKLKVSLAKLFSSYKFPKVLWHCLTAWPLVCCKKCLVSAVEGSTQPKCVLQCFKCYKLTFCLYFMYYYWRGNCMCSVTYLDVAWEQISRVPGEVDLRGTLFLCYIWRRVNFNDLSLMQFEFLCTVPARSTVLLPTQMWPENKFPESQEKWNSKELCLLC